MNEFLTRYSGKLYSKDQIHDWDLPPKIKDKLKMEEYNYFFITASDEKEHGTQIHVHLTIYPSKFRNVYLLVAQLPEIKPEVLHQTLSNLKEKHFDIVSSTGFCRSSDLCFFGVFFSSKDEIDSKALNSEITTLESIEKVRIYQYTCEGYSEI